MSAETQVPEGIDPGTGEVLAETPTEPEPETQTDEPDEDAPLETEEPDDDLPEPDALTPEDLVKMEEQAQRDAEKLLDKLDREAKRHRDRLAEILQDDVFNLIPCELCRADLAGFIDQTQPMPEEVRARVRIQIGDREPRKLRQDPHTERCATCDGETVVETGAKDGPNVTLACVDCGGRGWVATDDKRAGFRPATPLPPSVPSSPETENGGPVSHPALSAEDQAKIAELKAKGIVVITPTVA